MALDKGIKHGKEHRKPYRRAGKYDRTCRPGGSCSWCRNGRQHQHRREKERTRADHDQD